VTPILHRLRDIITFPKLYMSTNTFSSGLMYQTCTIAPQYAISEIPKIWLGPQI